MIRFLAALVGLLVMAGVSHAASTDVVFKGGLVITSTTGCTTGWNPAKQFFVGTYWVPVASTTNGPNSTLALHSYNSSEAFVLSNGSFTTAYKAVKAWHIYTLTGNYNAFVKVASQVPATIAKTTQSVVVTGSIKGWDWDANCVINFKLDGLRDLQP